MPTSQPQVGYRRHTATVESEGKVLRPAGGLLAIRPRGGQESSRRRPKGATSSSTLSSAARSTRVHSGRGQGQFQSVRPGVISVYPIVYVEGDHFRRLVTLASDSNENRFKIAGSMDYHRPSCQADRSGPFSKKARGTVTAPYSKAPRAPLGRARLPACPIAIRLRYLAGASNHQIGFRVVAVTPIAPQNRPVIGGGRTIDPATCRQEEDDRLGT